MNEAIQNRRTTPQLVQTAIEGAKRAGLPVSAVEVRGGGIVRILVGEVENTTNASEAKTCDAIFEERSG
ncbi:hypothetical protein [Pelagimonas varians]|uniref:Uncharacterized protein n=1 Tax=Pelagimonas varians TaxID=696760 RepID=A0A238K512_9RHOB|nr:hypothetical protein [Pelagimonas varians]PYG30357.1 hypothetical protein C8N36_10665 [Pelagimonas varians]SMX37863.1 hypothetical protein PEV8663_01225 [Pelagimonas varians]